MEKYPILGDLTSFKDNAAAVEDSSIPKSSSTC